MGLDVDVSRAFRGPAARKRLVEAIRDADPSSPETDWLEWKRRVDLRDKAWQGEIARQIIGFANRDPARAHRTVDGHAYLVLGVEPGCVDGVDVVDVAELESWVARYAGAAGGPRWEPHYVRVEDRHVLVIEVDPPLDGDPVHAVRKSFADPARTTIADGTIPVRRQGKTERATSADLDLLNRRASRSSSGLRLRLGWWGDPVTLGCVDVSESARAAWIEKERDRLLQPLRQHEPSEWDDLGRSLLRAMGEIRSADAYRAEVDNHLLAAERLLRDEAAARLVASGFGTIQLAIENQTDHNFEQVAIELHVPGAVAAFFDADEARDAVEFPPPPILWGTTRTPFPILDLSVPTIPPVRPRRGWIDNSASARIAFNPVHIRPLHSHALPPVHLIVFAEHAGETLHGTWFATSTSVSGSDSGEVALAIDDTPISLEDALAREAMG